MASDMHASIPGPIRPLTTTDHDAYWVEAVLPLNDGNLPFLSVGCLRR
jgi:hypothetical protein